MRLSRPSLVFSALAFLLVIAPASGQVDPTTGAPCTLPADPGPCDGVFPRFFFNAQSGRCESFVYGGCEGNDNNYETLEQCEAGCSTCRLPADVGPCDAAIPRWYFDSGSGACEMFTYGGCEGNANNFETQAECERACDLCRLDPDVGPCDGVCPRWHFDDESGTCQLFDWGCCGGNANNFETESECLRACQVDVCLLPADPGPCEAAIPRWYFDATTGNCEEFLYGGCEGNGNNFETQRECELHCNVCDLPADVGPCDAICPRWFFNSESGACEEFTWGCCGGNANNYETEEQCEAACGPDPSPCLLPPDPGPCDGVFPRWHFDAGTGSCDQFVWGGCGGNANNYETEEQCEAACSTCDLPPDPGPCDGICPRWYHDAETGTCEVFDYGCCGGNANNYLTEAECLRACDPATCTLPPDPGECDAVFPRWYFNAGSGQCEMFIWGGCGGNGNNFETQEECEASCNTCELPADVGPCDGVCPRWFFNAETGSCEEFTWGCCGGNANNFETAAECLAACDPTCCPPEVVARLLQPLLFPGDAPPGGIGIPGDALDGRPSAECCEYAETVYRRLTGEPLPDDHACNTTRRPRPGPGLSRRGF
ncbi:MAG: BPTI/Kunitz domain-containing protein [Acidobacteriota bacterium]